jgi:biopolymer transport protein ExbD
MNVGSSGEGEDAVISAINTTPLVDVMLVMLIIFLITIPVVTTSVPVTLPKERVEIRETKPENIIISVDTAGSVFWYDQKITSTEALVDKLKKVSKLDPST